MPFPDVALVATDTTGDLVVYRGGSWNVEATLCDDGSYDPAAALEVAADGHTVLVTCPAPTSQWDTARRATFLYDVATKRSRTLPPIVGGVAAMSPDASLVVVGGPGDCPMPAPVCQTRWYLRDLATGQQQDLLPSDYWLRIEFRWTAVGLTYFLPQCAEAGCPGVEKSGTYSYSFSTKRWMKISSDRLVLANGVDRTIFERRESLSERADSRVVEVYRGQERMLTTAGASQEVAVALLADGRTLAWRPDGAGALRGAIVSYRDGREERTTSGAFSSYFNSSSGDIALSAATPFGGAWVIYAYSSSADAFASMTLTFPFQSYRVLTR